MTLKYGEFEIITDLPPTRRATMEYFDDGHKDFEHDIMQVLWLLQLRPKCVGHVSNILKYEKALQGGYIKIAKNGNIRWTAKGKATLEEQRKRTRRFTFICYAQNNED